MSDEMENITKGILMAMVGLKDIGGDLVRIVPQCEDNHPLAIGLVCLSPDKAALIDAYVASLESDDAEEAQSND